jgi:hypothetical protein
MTPTRAEVKAAIETAQFASEYLCRVGHDEPSCKHAAILRSLLSTFDAKADFEEAAMKVIDDIERLPADDALYVGCHGPFYAAYRRLFAAQEEKK